MQGLLVTGLERPAADGRAFPFRQERTGALPCGPTDLPGHSIAGGSFRNQNELTRPSAVGSTQQPSPRGPGAHAPRWAQAVHNVT